MGRELYARSSYWTFGEVEDHKNLDAFELCSECAKKERNFDVPLGFIENDPEEDAKLLQKWRRDPPKFSRSTMVHFCYYYAQTTFQIKMCNPCFGRLVTVAENDESASMDYGGDVFGWYRENLPVYKTPSNKALTRAEIFKDSGCKRGQPCEIYGHFGCVCIHV
jgi:hypothetical protein